MIAFDTISVESTMLEKGYHFGSAIMQKIFELESKLGAKLSITQKILLAETGTVEQVLSILTDSAVSVKVVQQKERNHVITREAIIVSNNTGKLLIRAYSKVFLSNLPPKAQSLIKQKQASIGGIIYNLRLETFRRIIEIGYDQGNKLAFRKYHIIHKNKVAFEIKEELLLEREEESKNNEASMNNMFGPDS